jgi:multicomponent Na+:H+ antiporter subunit E
MVFYLTLTALLLGLYLALTANLELINIIWGALLSLGILALMRPPVRQLSPFDILSRFGLFIRYLILLAVDLVKSGIVVARIVIQPSMPIHPGIIAVKSPCKSELATALNAHALTITPGELVVEIGSDGTLYAHCLDATHGEEIILEAQKLRRELLMKIIQ